MELIKSNWTNQDIKDLEKYLEKISRPNKIQWTRNIIQTALPLLAIESKNLVAIAKQIHKGNYLDFLDEVLFDKKNNRYIGYSHRAFQSFGIGDMLFDKNVTPNKDFYYKNKKYRFEYLKTLFKYHIKNDWHLFMDLCEDTIIGYGIMNVVPFREQGRKIIETKEEAFEAACNFAKYVS